MIKITNFYSEEEIERYYQFLMSKESKKIDKVGNEIVSFLNELLKENKEKEISDFRQLITMSFAELKNLHNLLKINKSGYERLLEKKENQDLLDIYKQYYSELFTSIDGKNKIKNNISLIKDLGITVCPYCNRNYINPRDVNSGCEFDHYYNKKEYPFFALTLSNLVPSCSTCNRIKGTNDYDFFPFDLEGNIEVKFVVSPPSQNSKIKILLKKKSHIDSVLQIYEETVDGDIKTVEDCNFMNDYIPETVTVKGTKTWGNESSQNCKYPDKIRVLLNKTVDGVTTQIAEKEVSKDHQSYEFTALPKYENGREITYSVDEETQIDDILKLEKAYEIHTVDVDKMFKREEEYCQKYREDLISLLKVSGDVGINFSEEFLDSMIFGEIANDSFDDYLNYSLSKLKKDTYDYIVELR